MKQIIDHYWKYITCTIVIYSVIGFAWLSHYLISEDSELQAILQ